MSKLNILPKRMRGPAGRMLSKTLTSLRILSWLLQTKSHTGADGVEPSVLIPANFDSNNQKDELVKYAIDLARESVGSHPFGLDRMNADQAAQVRLWPGEHYLLLQALVRRERPTLVVEIGTFTGLSALQILGSLPENARLVTYDLVAWNKFPGTVLRKEDFGKSFEQRLGDLSSDKFFVEQLETLLNADLIFMDGPKDGKFEQKFFSLFQAYRRKPGLMIWDDIRFLQMAEMWRTLEWPKCDLTSFGHWTGTGLVRIVR